MSPRTYFWVSTPAPHLSPDPWKMRLEMVHKLQIEILNGGEILVN